MAIRKESPMANMREKLPVDVNRTIQAESFVMDFSFTMGVMFLETFLASKTNLTAKERADVKRTVMIVKKYYLTKK